MATEIESRYIVPDPLLFRRLRRLRALGECTLEPQGVHHISDDYLDTKGRALLHQGWACRLRTQGDICTVTLKGPKQTEGAISTRLEQELLLPAPETDAARWPAGELRDRVRDLATGLPLRRQVTIRQERREFLVKCQERPVAILSLDDVLTLGQAGLRQRSYLVECELTTGGALDDLRAINRVLEEEYGLIPETRSKLQRALAMIEQGRSPDADVASRPLSVEALCRRYGVDMARAERTATLAEALFDGLAEAHHLSLERRVLLRAAALLVGVGDVVDRPIRQVVGRDLLLAQPIAGLTEAEQRAVAAAVYLHRKKISPERLRQAFPRPLDEPARCEALWIAALLRMAAALNKSDDAMRLERIAPAQDGYTVTLVGPGAHRQARRAADRSDLWRQVSGIALSWEEAELAPSAEGGAAAPAEMSTTAAPITEVKASTEETWPTEEPPPLSASSRAGLDPGDTMAQAAAKTLTLHLQRMLKNEPGARLGEDPEALHDMRVAIRRMRSALRFFGPYIAGELTIRANDRLREVARALGRVRDLDVAISNAEAFQADTFVEPTSAASLLAPLLATWNAERDDARQDLLVCLDGPVYRSAVDTLWQLIAELERSPLAPAAEPMEQTARRLIYLDWHVVRAYEAVLDNAPIELLHTLRIDCKRLRYAFEFTAEVLPPEARRIIPEVVAMQDHLGALHDAIVAAHRLDRMMTEAGDVPEWAGARAYRDALRAEAERLERSFPEVWAHLMRPQIQNAVEGVLRRG